MRPRPEFPSVSPEDVDAGQWEHFKNEEREWFEELLAHPHVQEVMKIPADEPIFVLRAQDINAPDAVEYWLSESQRVVTPDKFQRAAERYKEILEWQNVEPTRAKIPD